MKQTCTAVALYTEVLKNRNYQFFTLQIEFEPSLTRTVFQSSSYRSLCLTFVRGRRLRDFAWLRGCALVGNRG